MIDATGTIMGLKKEGAELAFERDPALKHQCQHQRQHHRQRYGKPRKNSRIFDRDLKRAVVPDVDIVLESHKAVVQRACDE